MDKKTAAFWLVVGAIDDAIKEAGEKGIPEGHLYAMLMDKMSLEFFTGIIKLLVKVGKIKNKNHLLTTI